MSSLGNFTAPSLSRLFTRKDHVQYTPGHRGDAAYLVNRFGARHGEILVPETWQGNFDGSDSVSDPVDWYAVDEMRMEYVVTKEEVICDAAAGNAKVDVFKYTLTHSSPGRTSLVQTGECTGSRTGGSYDSGANKLNYTSIIVGFPITTGGVWQLNPQIVQQSLTGVTIGGPTLHLDVPINSTISPDPPTENWLLRKGWYEADLNYTFRGLSWGYVSGQDVKKLSITARPFRETTASIAQAQYIRVPTNYSFGDGGGNNLFDCTPMTTNPLWTNYIFVDKAVEGNNPPYGEAFKIDLTLTRM